MTIVPILLLTLAVPVDGATLHSTSDVSDTTRVAIAIAALEHSIERTKAMIEFTGTEPDRIILDVPWVSDEWLHAPAVMAVAEVHGLEARDFSEHPALLACVEERRSAACRAGRGVTSIQVGAVRVLEPTRAEAGVQIRVLAGTGRASNEDFWQSSRLRLQKIDGVWKVVGLGLTIGP